MFTEEELRKLSAEDIQKQDPETRALTIKILTEMAENGYSQTLRDIWLVDYEEIPVSIDEFICNPKYLGKVTGNGSLIYPFWKEQYREIFDASKNYEEMVFTGAIGIGKTRTGVICLCYLLYRLMCLRNPNAYFNLLEGDKITIFFLNITLDLARGVGYNTMHEFLMASPWFMERGTVTGVKNLVYNPPKNIIIEYGSSGGHGLGKAIFAAMLDEVDFKKAGMKGTSALDASSAIMEAYRIIKGRISSRFIKKGVLYGKLFLVSSKKSEHDFLEQYVKKMYNEKMLVIDKPQWVVKPKGTFSEVTFPVAVGNKSLKSMVLPDDITEEERKAYIKQGYQIIDVPENFRHEFKLDINTALMDKAGISIIGATTFFNYDMFSQCYIKDYKNPFSADILTIGLHDDLQIYDFFEIDKVPLQVRAMPQFIHVDASLTGDKTGISDVGVSGIKESMIYDGANETIVNEMTYKHIFSVDILAPHGTEISFEKTRKFIYYLRSQGFNIVGVSLDGFQSADTRQALELQGYDATIISLDRSPQGYLSLRSAMNDKRIGLIQIDLLETELIQLQRDVKTGKLDHPIDGCFTGNTNVIILDKGKVKNISIDDLLKTYKDSNYCVQSVNPETGEKSWQSIEKVFETKRVKELLMVSFNVNGNLSTVSVTDNHRFMLPDRTYKEIGKLEVGQQLFCIDGTAFIESIKHVKHSEYIPVYDIQVNGIHNFTLFNKIVVHNSKDMADSLAGALFNAVNHKQSLIDNMQMITTMLDVNTDASENLKFTEQQMPTGETKLNINKNWASDKLNELLSSYEDTSSGILFW